MNFEAHIPELHGLSLTELTELSEGQSLSSLAAGTEGTPSFDALLLVATDVRAAAAARGAEVQRAFEAAASVDATVGRPGRPPAVVAAPGLPGGRLVLSGLPALTDDIEDVRLVAEAVSQAVARAVDAGSRRPLLALSLPSLPKLAHATEVAALAALGSQWAPLEAREAEKAPAHRAERIGVLGLAPERARELRALEAGRCLARDIAGTEPERMAPKRVAELCRAAFAGGAVEVSVEEDVSDFPLLAAVARASMPVERHRPCIVRLDYRPQGPIERTVVLVGKGVTYDMGGADLKTDGHMAGASRDKGGAAAVAGLLRAVEALRLPGVHVIGLLGLVRNSIGEEAFVSDEIIRSRAGVRVRIGNTDAEGRLVLADLLAYARELCADAPGPHILSLATLTGHVYRAFGPYVGAIGNSAARARGGLVDLLDGLGELWGEPLERSRPRREDFTLVAPRSSAEDVVSANRLASVNTSRGHQFPYAFLEVASGLRHTSLPLLHLDIAGVVVDPPDWQFGRPTASPVLSLAAWLAGEVPAVT